MLIKEQTSTWALALKRSPLKKLKPAYADYAAKPSPPCCPRVFLASAHTNKLMIIVRESTTQENTPQQK